jgi:hypothetical protein
VTEYDRIKTQYRRFAENECKGYSDLYYALAHAAADDDDVIAFIAQMPVTQPNLFFASIQFLTGPERMPTSRETLSEVVRDRGAEIASLMRSRRTQTNEVGRCTALLPALPHGRLALLEVGASAGLCLLLDEYAYDYGGVTLGSESSPVRLTCGVTGNPTIPTTMPQVAWRAGLDINPLDAHDEGDARWLLSCVWPEHVERRDRLAAAIALAQSRELALHRGDLVADLPALLAQVPSDATLVVFHSAVLVYVSEEARRNFSDILVEESRRRDIVWISNESPTVVPEITALAPPVKGTRFLLGRTRLTQGQRQDELLALTQPHGAELEWLNLIGGPRPT